MARGWWLALFTFLLTLSLVAPGLAVEGPAEPASESGVVTPPGDQQVAAAIAQAEEEEAKREEELESPDAIRERAESRLVYADLSESAARQLLLDVFGSQLALLDSDPARYLSDVKLEKAFDGGATVSDDGHGTLLEAGIPVRAENEQGDLEKIDLDLVQGAGGFAPANPLVDVLIPPKADEPVAVGEEGLAITTVGQGSIGTSLQGEDVYYPEIATDTDLLVAPTASGIELFDLLRSVESPELLPFELDLPVGATLHANGAGGADVVKDGETIAFVTPPSAIDAQGTQVATTLRVDGASIAVEVPHRKGDFAYPILVDPQVVPITDATWWYGGANLEALSAWQFNASDETQTYMLRSTTCISSLLCSPSGRGLFVSSVSRPIPPHTYTQWFYNVPGQTTFIPSIFPEASAVFNPFWRNNESCNFNTYPEPYDYDGGYDINGNYVYFSTDRAQFVGSDSIFTKAKGVAFGLSTGAVGVSLPCWRHIMLGGIGIRLDDAEAPTLSTAGSFPSGWIGANASFTVGFTASDPGLGVRNVSVNPEGRPPLYLTDPSFECPGTKTQRCPATVTAPFALNSGQFDEGEKKVRVSAYDPTGKTSPTIEQVARVDRTPPEVSLSGQLAKATDEVAGDGQDPAKWDELSLPVYKLNISATDGVSGPNPETRRSGVKSIEVFIDEQKATEGTWTQTCPANSCAMERTFTLKLGTLTPQKHVLKVIARDQLNQPSQRLVEFEYLPATGEKDEYAMERFPLPDGLDHSGELPSHGPEIAVNLANGNLVFHQRDVNVEGPAVDLEVERYFNSLLPSSEDTEWGDGWTLAQTPDLRLADPGASPAGEDPELVDTSGAITAQLSLPSGPGSSRFEPSLQSTIRSEGGGFEFSDDSGDSEATTAFGTNGRPTEVRGVDGARIDYSYSEGMLSEIEVKDPTSSVEPPEEPVAPPVAADLPSYVSDFVSVGTVGAAVQPIDVALDSQARLLIVDRETESIARFDASGHPIAEFGSFGSGNAQFRRATAIAVDGLDRILVADAGNKRVQVLDSDGAFVRAFGSEGTGPGQFSGAGPEGIAVAPNGNILVSDTYGGRLLEFDQAGTFVKAIGAKGTGAGQLGKPTGLDVAASGDIWVADWERNQVTVFSQSGEFLRSIGSAGTGNGQFAQPDEIEIDSRGAVWVGDSGNGRIQKLSQEGVYLGQFGSPGNGTAQFEVGSSMGMTSDAGGRFWIADGDSQRVQKWKLQGYQPDYSPVDRGSFATGRVRRPGGIAADPTGIFWLLETSSNIASQVSAAGGQMGTIGSLPFANERMLRPAAIAVDSHRNVWVADTGRNRVARYSGSARMLSLAFGQPGTGDGMFAGPEGIAIGPEGNVWVADTHNGRLQVFDEKGKFLRVIGKKGSQPGELLEPCGIGFSASGNVWVADWANNRITEFTKSGEFVSQVGTAGTGPGQFQQPFGLTVDENGLIWVTDTGNDRVQVFGEDGVFVDAIGSPGSGPGQFNLGRPSGIASVDGGHLYIADSGNGRYQHWATPIYAAEEDVFERRAEANDPVVSVDVEGGLVESVEGEQAGEHTYAHSGDDLTSHTGPEGETRYEYTASGRLFEIKLPNGTTASMIYETALGRTKSVAIDPAGPEPRSTTQFFYFDDERKTTVTRPGSPTVEYRFGEDGSVLKSSNSPQPPDVVLSGSLHVKRVVGDPSSSIPIATGLHNLEVQAHAVEGVASIEVMDGDVIVSERSCPQDESTLERECVNLTDEWAVETLELEPGINEIEVLVKDTLGQFKSERFQVNIPFTPPPPEGDRRPTFTQIKAFRKDRGLDLDLDPVTQEQIAYDRVYDLIGAWNNPHTPEGQVARFATDNWGVPLRAIDVAELEYRDWYLSTNSPLIEDWGESHQPATFAGLIMDHAAGGIVRVGFTSDAAAHLEEMKQQLPLVARDRLAPYTAAQGRALVSLEGLMGQVAERRHSEAFLEASISTLEVDRQSNSVLVGATDASGVANRLSAIFGAAAPIRVVGQEAVPLAGNGTMMAGENLSFVKFENGQFVSSDCTAGYGAYERVPRDDGSTGLREWLLSAGHCGQLEKLAEKYRSPRGTAVSDPLGIVRLTGYPGGRAYETDALGVRLNGTRAPRYVLRTTGPRRVTEAGRAREGDELCFSGVVSGHVRCGDAKGMTEINFGKVDDGHGTGWMIKFDENSEPGDSGAPVWDRTTGKVVGLLSGKVIQQVTGRVLFTFATPLVQPKGISAGQAPGVFGAPGMGNIDLLEAP